MGSRIYKVDTRIGAESLTHLVIAVSPGRAQTHVAKKFINAKVATPHDVAERMGNGIKIEHADTADAPEEQGQADLEAAVASGVEV